MNLHLRALEPEDLGYLYDCENSPSLHREGTELALYSQHTLRRFIETSFLPVAETRQLRLIACEDAQRVGILDLYDIDLLHRHATLGLVVYPLEFRGKGYGLALLQLALFGARGACFGMSAVFLGGNAAFRVRCGVLGCDAARHVATKTVRGLH